MQALQRFQNSQFGDLEILTIEGKQWFPATEVAMTLGYSNPRDAISRHVKRRGVVNHDVIDSLGRKQNKKFIDEGNLYRLISRSKYHKQNNLKNGCLMKFYQPFANTVSTQQTM
ncbi:hypothetical protein CUR004 [Staphylococcus phage phiPVL-CN125]|uniref:Bro-N domain-containing protein n=1 Tax=Staphylococcus phage phiPVL-CN125 TaxID=648017 RepID=C5I626_9CAUD|nr:anti-repressor Ant [Staphylococcus phage phiPVL-CN125]ACR54193.1 hypothetical protein CUR004 [Staphylococcus phage phiPVL-CN125]